jgi:hypothetical protein
MLIQSILFSNIAHAEQLSLPAEDLKAPEVEHTPISEPLSSGAMHRISATVTDNVGVDVVSLFYRHVGDSQYQRKPMLRETQDSDVFTVALGRNDLAAPGIEYYIQATDMAGNSVLFGYSFEPIKLSVLSGSDSTETTDTALSESLNGDGKQKKKGGSKWIWIALGALTVGAIAAAASGGGGGDSGGGGGDSGTVTVSGPVPQ